MNFHVNASMQGGLIPAFTISDSSLGAALLRREAIQEGAPWTLDCFGAKRRHAMMVNNFVGWF